MAGECVSEGGVTLRVTVLLTMQELAEEQHHRGQQEQSPGNSSQYTPKAPDVCLEKLSWSIMCIMLFICTCFPCCIVCPFLN